MTNWTEIFNRWKQPLQRLAYRYLHDHQLAEDIVQDIFLCLLEQKLLPQFMQDADTYLRASVFKRCMSCIRKKKTQISIDNWIQDQLTTNTTEEQLRYRELTQQYLKAIHQLPQREKEIYLLAHFGGYRKEKLSRHLNKSAKTIKKQLQVSNKKIRTALQEQRA